MPNKNKYPGYRWDANARRYRQKSTGDIKTIAEIEATLQLQRNEPENDGGYGQKIFFNRHPETDARRVIENIIFRGEKGDLPANDQQLKAIGKKYNDLVAHIDRDDMQGADPYPALIKPAKSKTWVVADNKNTWIQPPQAIPTGIRSAMTLSEHYCNTEGDVWQHVEAPIDIAISELEISVPKDKSIERKLKELYSPEKLNMRYIIYQNWLSTAVYGSAYPVEIPNSADKPEEILQIMPLPPKFMWVGYNMTPNMLTGPNMPSPYAIRPMDGSANWTQKLAQQMFMPMTYNAYGAGFNDQISQGWGLPVNPDYLHPIRAKAFHWNRYPLPSISRAFRSIGTRAIYQEMRRGTLEGFKNQLWVFLLGNEKMPASPQEMLALKGAVDGISGTRTGSLVWRNGLEVKVIAPNALIDALGNEVSQEFTLEIFRDLGDNIRLITGNKISMPGSGAGDSGVDIDLSVWLRRMEFIRSMQMEWEYMFRLRQADLWDHRKPDGPPGPARKALETARVKFSKSLLEVAARIKQEIVPVYQVGLSSPQTSLSKADMDYDTELENKKANKKNEELFMPPATFNQTATNAAGETKKSSSAPSKGRPSDSVSPAKLKAAWEDSRTRKLYYSAIMAALDELIASSDVETFVADLKLLNQHWLNLAGTEAYREAGGFGNPDPESLKIASDYVNSYADNFGDDLRAALEASEPLGTNSVLRRGMYYPQEGFKAATVNMTNQAMSERGASHWRRVLHPELSKAGPCPDCVADSQVVHEMSEPFAIMHNNDVCGTQEINLQYFTNGIPSIEIPVPAYGNDLAHEIFGDRKRGTTRRKRL